VPTDLPAPVLSHLQSLPTDNSAINLAKTALILAQVQQPDISLERYQNHLKTLAKQTAERFKEADEDTATTRLDTIRTILMDEHAYQGNTQTYDDLQNANLIRVIERRKGLPVSLCILTIHVARAQGWTIHGLNVPGHVLCRLDHGGQQLIFDPFDQWKPLNAADLRALIKRTAGEDIELSADYFTPATNREILIRLQNNIKFRQIEAEDYHNALQTVETLRLIAPDEYRLLLEAGVLNARLNHSIAAIDALEKYVRLAPDSDDRYEASLLLQDLKSSLN